MMQERRRKGNTSGRRRNGSGRGPGAWSWAAGKGEFLGAAAYLAVAALFGGGVVAWSPSVMVLGLATIVLALLLAWRDGFAVLSRAPLTARIALVGIAVLPLLQLLPLPSSVWQALPGQEIRRATLALVGTADRWQPMTLEPGSTALSALMAIGFVVFVGTMLRMSDADFRRLLTLTFALILLGIVVGLFQVVSDGHFPQIQADNMGATMFGFYANKNHMAMAIACSILMFGLVISRDRMAPDKRRLAAIGYVVFALVCIVTTNSRAGLGLGALASAIVMADLARGVPLRFRLAALVGIGVLVFAIMSSSAFEVVSGRVDDVSSDLRWRIASWSWPLTERYWQLGSGLGSFKTLFAANEQLAWVKPTYVNAAHNDYLQLVIEAGLPGVALLLLLVASLPARIVAFRALPGNDSRRGQIGFGFAVLALFAIHSAVDYPLRRPAAWALFAIALVAVCRRHEPQNAFASHDMAVRAEAA